MLILGKNIYITIDNISIFRKKSYLEDIPNMLIQKTFLLKVILLVFFVKILKKLYIKFCF